MFWFKGLLIGFSIAAPVGPIGLLCIQRTLTDGRAVGLAAGLGAASADAVYGSIAGFGLTTVASLLLDWQNGLRLMGGVFLLYLGLRTLLATPTEPGANLRSAGLLRDYASTFLLTLTNPMTILAFVGIFAGLGLVGGAGDDFAAAGVLVLGVFLGSACWWLILVIGVGAVRQRLAASALLWINRISGAIMMGFGVLALLPAAG